MSFDKEISQGNFVISECTICKKIVWPSSLICNNCFGKTVLIQAPRDGIIMEFSKTGEVYFCIVEFANKFRLICSMHSQIIPKIGDQVSLVNCGIKDSMYNFEVKLIKK